MKNKRDLAEILGIAAGFEFILIIVVILAGYLG